MVASETEKKTLLPHGQVSRQPSIRVLLSSIFSLSIVEPFHSPSRSLKYPKRTRKKKTIFKREEFFSPRSARRESNMATAAASMLSDDFYGWNWVWFFVSFSPASDKYGTDDIIFSETHNSRRSSSFLLDSNCRLLTCSVWKSRLSV